MVEHLTRARNRLTKFYYATRRCGGPGRTGLTNTRRGWPRNAATSRRCRRPSSITGPWWVSRYAQLTAVEADLKLWLDRAPFADPVRRLGSYRGVTTPKALPGSPGGLPHSYS